MKTFKYIALSILLVLSTNVVAQTVKPSYFMASGGDLYTYCTTPSVDLYCAGIIVGIYGTLYTHVSRELCVPDRVSKKVLVAVVEQYLTKHPEHHWLVASFSVEDAIHEAWPCKE